MGHTLEKLCCVSSCMNIYEGDMTSVVLDVPWHFGTYSPEQGMGVATAPGAAWRRGQRDKGVSDQTSAKDPSVLLHHPSPLGSFSGVCCSAEQY